MLTGQQPSISSMQRSLLCALLSAASLATAAPAFAWSSAPVRNPANGHYYAFFNGADGVQASRPALPFADALTRAASMSHLGIPGHLATITTQAEQDFIHEYFLEFTRPPSNPRFPARDLFWIAASDAAVEGEWRWVAGPEAGQQFWQGNYNGFALDYQNWTFDGGHRYEPNNEDTTFPRDPAGEDAVALNLNADQFYLSSWWNDVSAIGEDRSWHPRLGVVEFSPIPEPSSVALIGSAFIAIFAARRRRFR